jgi:hypothetical protein
MFIFVYKLYKKFKFPLCIINQTLCHEDVGGGGGSTAPPFLTSALNGDVRSTSHPYRFTPGEIVRRRLGGPQSGSGRCAVEKYLLPLPGIESRLQIFIYLFIYLFTYLCTHKSFVQVYWTMDKVQKLSNFEIYLSISQLQNTRTY